MRFLDKLKEDKIKYFKANDKEEKVLNALAKEDLNA